MKPVPSTDMVKASLPAVMTEGKRFVTAGVALKGSLSPPPQLPRMKTAATDSSATERERFKTSLLENFNGDPEAARRQQPGTRSEETQQTACKSPARQRRLIASRHAARQLGFGTMSKGWLPRF